MIKQADNGNSYWCSILGNIEPDSFLMRIELGIPGYVLLIAFYGIIIAISQNQADNGNSYWCSILGNIEPR